MEQKFAVRGISQVKSGLFYGQSCQDGQPRFEVHRSGEEWVRVAKKWEELLSFSVVADVFR